MTTLHSIQRAIDLIEENLTQPLSIDALARSAAMSPSHFQRTFSAMVGEPVGRYIRRRRISAAAKRLFDYEGRLIDLALDYQFESHEAFTRAFKSELEATPSDWRNNKGAIRHPRRRAFLTQESIDQRYLSMNLMPEFTRLDPATFIGFEDSFISPSSKDADNLLVIPRLWDRFFQRMSEIPSNDPGASYGLAQPPEALDQERTHPDQSLYLAAARVDPETPIPDGMARWTSPGGLFAKFEHHGASDTIGDTMAYIYGKWFPESEYTEAPGAVYQRIDKRFNPSGENSMLEIFVPVTRA